MKKIVERCPVCNDRLIVTNLACESCDLSVKGRFAVATPFSALPAEQVDFILTFLAARGSIKEVEKRLGISYPTVRNRLDAVIEALGLSEPAGGASAKDVLEKLEAGAIDANEAVEMLEGRK